MKHKVDQSTDKYKVYKRLPKIVLKCAFECSNGCTNNYTKQGRFGNLNSKIYVIKSIVPKEKMAPQLHAAIENDSTIKSFIRKDWATTVIWVVSNDIIRKKGSLLVLFNNKQFIQILQHGVWEPITKLITTEHDRKHSLDKGYNLNSIPLQR